MSNILLKVEVISFVPITTMLRKSSCYVENRNCFANYNSHVTITVTNRWTCVLCKPGDNYLLVKYLTRVIHSGSNVTYSLCVSFHSSMVSISQHLDFQDSVLFVCDKCCNVIVTTAMSQSFRHC